MARIERFNVDVLDYASQARRRRVGEEAFSNQGQRIVQIGRRDAAA